MPENKIADLKEYFQEFLVILNDRLSGVLDVDGEVEFQRQFSHLVAEVENIYVDVYSNSEQEKKLHQEIPGIVPYWNLIKELRRYDGKLFGALTEDKETTMVAVSKLVSSKETLDFTKHKSTPNRKEIPFEDFDDASSNVKILRVGHFVAYAMSGKGSALIKKLALEELTDEDRHRKIYDDFKKSVHFVKFRQKQATIYNSADRRRSQPGPHITDGMVFNDNGDEGFMVFSTAKSDFEGQGRQLFDYIKWILDPANRKAAGLENLENVTPVFVCYPLIDIDSRNAFGGLFKSSVFNPREIELFNSVPFISMLSNVDNSDTPGSLDTLMNTSFYTLGGGPSLTWHSRMKEVSLIQPPQRHKDLLKSFAKRMKAVATVVHSKVSAEKTDTLNVGNLNGRMFSFLNGMSSSIQGLIQHAAHFKDDLQFVREISESLGNAAEQFEALTKKLNPSLGIQPLQILSTFTDAIEKLEPDLFSTRIRKCEVIKLPESKGNTIAWDPVRDALKEYAEKVVNPQRDIRHAALGLKVTSIDFESHFSWMLRHKINYGVHAPFTNTKGDLGGAFAPCIKKFMEPGTKAYNEDFPELNRVLAPVLRILRSNHTTDDILEALKTEMHSQLNKTNKVGAPEVEQEDILSM